MTPWNQGDKMQEGGVSIYTHFFSSGLLTYEEERHKEGPGEVCHSDVPTAHGDGFVELAPSCPDGARTLVVKNGNSRLVMKDIGHRMLSWLRLACLLANRCPF